jgi:hypothetical protein
MQLYAKLLVMCILTSFACIPAIADTATFSEAASMTVTFPDLTNVAYSVVSNNLTVTPFEQGNAALVYSSQSFSWSNGTLSYEFDPSSGRVSSPSGTSNILQEYATSLEIVNKNDYSVEMPVTVFLSYEGSSTSTASTYSLSQGTIQVLYIPPNIVTEDTQIAAGCVGSPSNCYSYVISGPGSGTLTSPVSVTGSFLLPADSTSMFEVFPQTLGEAGFVPAIPEPGTFVLLGTGILALAGASRRKLSCC